jgi:hypothetical protein
MPFRTEFLKLNDTIIKPLLLKFNIDDIIESEDFSSGPIVDHILKSIDKSFFCIADVSENNPNVIYEVALAHSKKKPVILITKGNIADVPFDIRHYRVIKYDDDDLFTLSEKLKEAIATIISSEESTLVKLRKILIPDSIDSNNSSFVVAANPLSYRAAFRDRGGWNKAPITFADHLGVRGLIQSFGLIFGLEKLPELICPDDYDDKVVINQTSKMNIYSIGSTKANNWTGLLLDQFFKDKCPKWEFKPDPDSKEIMNPKVILRRDHVSYSPCDLIETNIQTCDFGIIIRGPQNNSPQSMFLVLAGRSSLGTEATCRAITDPECLDVLYKHLDFHKIDINNHHDSFCAIVSIKYINNQTSINDFKVHEVIKYS